MILPDNIHPEQTVYYNGSIILEHLQENCGLGLIELYARIKESSSMSFPLFILSLDWLYLLGVAEVNSQGVVNLCLSEV